MIAGLLARGRRIGEAARRRSIVRLAAQLRAVRPDARVAEERDGVTVTGRGVLRDPRLIWIGSWLR